MMRRLLAIVVLVLLLVLVGFVLLQASASSTEEAIVPTLAPAVFIDTQMIVGEAIYDGVWTSTVIHVHDDGRTLSLDWDAGFIAEIEGSEYVVCPTGLSEQGMWRGYVVPTSDTTTIHCLNDPEPPRITEVRED